MDKDKAAEPPIAEALYRRSLDAILLIQEGRGLPGSLAGAFTALREAFLLDAAYFYKARCQDGDGSAPAEFSMLYEYPAGNTPASVIASAQLPVELMDKLSRGLYLRQPTRLMPASWQVFLPGATGAFCQLCPIVTGEQLCGLIAVSGEEERLKQELPLRCFGQSLGQFMALDAAAEREKERWKPVKAIGASVDITRRKETESALKESEALFRSLFEDSPLAILLIDESGRIKKANPKFEALLGYPPEEAVGRDYMSFNEPGRAQPFRAKRLRHAICRRAPSIQFEQELRHKKGYRLWAGAMLSFNYQPDGQLSYIICTLEDITERRIARKALEESEAVQKAILNALPDLKFRIRADGVFLDYFASPGENDKLFAPPEQFLGKPVREVLPEYLHKAIMKNLQLAIETGKPQAFEYPLMVNSQLCYFEARISTVNEEEAIVVVRDITALKITQKELQDKLRELDHNNQKLKKYVDSNLQLEHFAHTVSHDLREPVRTIHSFSQLLQKKYDGQLDEDAGIFLDFITSSASSMNVLIEDLLEYSRFDFSQHETELIPLEQLLMAVSITLDKLIAERNASITICTPLPVVRGNWTKISQAFQNLLSNAIKFSRPDEAPLIEISAREKEQEWEFAIKDNGIGISPEYHEQIFLLFRRLHSKKHFPGSGIGLSLCKRVIEQHGGKIWVDSQPGKGSVFYFTLPKS